MAEYEIQIQTPLGVTLAAVGGPGTGAAGALGLEYLRAVNQVGALTLTLPPAFPLTYLQRDGRVLVYRSVADVPPRLDMDAVWLIVGVQRLLSERGEQRTVVTAVDAVDLLRRRIVAYAAGSAQAAKTAAADDLIKAVVRENLGSSATDTSRQLSPSLFSVSADITQGISISKAFSRREVLKVCQEVADACAQAGTYLAFDVVWNGATLEFRTYTQWRGVDHRFPGGANPVLLSPDTGSLTAASYATDYRDEVTYAYAGGQGEGSDRAVGTSTDSTRATLSPFARIEAWVDARNTASSTTLADEADAAVRAGRPRVLFSCTVNADSPGAMFGKEYGFGDVVTAQAFGVNVDCRLDAVGVKVMPDSETVTVTARSVT